MPNNQNYTDQQTNRVGICYKCKGKEVNCQYYSADKIGDMCDWYKVIESDLEKIARGDNNLTFPQLKEIKEVRRIF